MPVTVNTSALTSPVTVNAATASVSSYRKYRRLGRPQHSGQASPAVLLYRNYRLLRPARSSERVTVVVVWSPPETIAAELKNRRGFDLGPGVTETGNERKGIETLALRSCIPEYVCT